MKLPLHQAAAKSTSSVPLLEVTQEGSSRAEQSLKRTVTLARSWHRPIRCPTSVNGEKKPAKMGFNHI